MDAFRARVVFAAAAVAVLAACAPAGAPSDSGASPKADQAKQSAQGAPLAAPEKAAPWRLIMLGDSLTAGYGLRPEEALPVRLEAALKKAGRNVVVVNAGVSGDTMADALARADWALDQPADGLLVALGGNDLLRGVDPAETEKALAAILAKGKARGLALLIAGMKAPGNYGPDWRARFDGLYARQAEAYGARLYPFLLDGVAGDRALVQADDIHANARGVDVIVSGLAPFVAESVEAAPERP